MIGIMIPATPITHPSTAPLEEAAVVTTTPVIEQDAEPAIAGEDSCGVVATAPISWTNMKSLFSADAVRKSSAAPRVLAMQACCKDGRCFLVPDPDTANCCGLAGGFIIGAPSCDPNPCPQEGLRWRNPKILQE
jgi:hypothetical protein